MVVIDNVARVCVPLTTGLPAPHTLDKFSLSIEAASEREPHIVFSDVDSVPITFKCAGNYVHSCLTASQPLTFHSPTALLSLEIPCSQLRPTISIFSDNEYSYLCIREPSPPACITKFMPRNVHLVWDSSFSRKYTDKSLVPQDLLLFNVTQELRVISNLISKMPLSEVEVFSFSYVCKSLGRFNSSAYDRILSCLETVSYEGGTDFSVLDKLPESDAVFLFSDGYSTLGPIKLPKISCNRLFTLTAASSANSILLTELAARQNGSFFHIMESSVASITEMMLTTSLTTFIGPSSSPILEQYYPEIQIIQASMPLVFAVRCSESVLSSIPKVELRFRLASGEITTTTYVLEKLHTSQFAPFCWARLKSSFLLNESSSGKNVEDEILAVGRKYGLVTPQTSFIVLHTLEQFLDNEIEPPESCANLRASFLLATTNRRQQAVLQRDKMIEAVFHCWRQKNRENVFLKQPSGCQLRFTNLLCSGNSREDQFTLFTIPAHNPIYTTENDVGASHNVLFTRTLTEQEVSRAFRRLFACAERILQRCTHQLQIKQRKITAELKNTVKRAQISAARILAKEIMHLRKEEVGICQKLVKIREYNIQLLSKNQTFTRELLVDSLSDENQIDIFLRNLDKRFKGDTIEEILENAIEEDETEPVLNQILSTVSDELGLELTQTNRAAEEPQTCSETDELEARLRALKNGSDSDVSRTSAPKAASYQLSASCEQPPTSENLPTTVSDDLVSPPRSITICSQAYMQHMQDIPAHPRKSEPKSLNYELLKTEYKYEKRTMQDLDSKNTDLQNPCNSSAQLAEYVKVESCGATNEFNLASKSTIGVEFGCGSFQVRRNCDTL